MPLTVWERGEAIQNLKRKARADDLVDALDNPPDRFRWVYDAEAVLLRYAQPTRDSDERPVRGAAETLVDLLGEALLEHSGVRWALAVRASERTRLYLLPEGSRARTPEGHATAIAGRPWRPGSPFARDFCEAFGFSAAFSGDSHDAEEDLVAIEIARAAHAPDPKPLIDYQAEAVAQARTVLAGEAHENKGILSLPTGAGKTLTAVRAILDAGLRNPGGTYLWIAQTQEVCEQAVREFARSWRVLEDAPHGAALRIGRCWGKFEQAPPFPDVLVAGIDKLDESPRLLTALRPTLRAVVIDEAHSATAPSYRSVLAGLGVEFRKDVRARIPILGLTATPGRASVDGTLELRALFGGSLLHPPLLDPNPVQKLREMGFLSAPVHDELDHPGDPIDFSANPRWQEHWERFRTIPPGAFKRIGEDGERNREIVRRIVGHLREPRNQPMIVFACSVAHAAALSALLRREGVRADWVGGSTRAFRRRALVESLKSSSTGSLQVLLNYGVLTIGFDAPNVGSIMIARPTTSSVLYEQMVGRGMRGPKFGGTEHCLLVDIKDNLRFGGQLAYERYAHLWGDDDVADIANLDGAPADASPYDQMQSHRILVPQPPPIQEAARLVVWIDGKAQEILVPEHARRPLEAWYQGYRARIAAGDTPSLGWLDSAAADLSHLLLVPRLSTRRATDIRFELRTG